jgi:predicted transcriptional regulator
VTEALAKRRQSRQDLSKCETEVLRILKKNPERYVTAGWLEDRGIGFNEHTIGIVLRKLHEKRTIDYVFAMGFQTYAYRTDVEELLKQRATRRKKHTPDGGSDV